MPPYNELVCFDMAIVPLLSNDYSTSYDIVTSTKQGDDKLHIIDSKNVSKDELVVYIQSLGSMGCDKLSVTLETNVFSEYYIMTNLVKDNIHVTTEVEFHNVHITKAKQTELSERIPSLEDIYHDEYIHVNLPETSNLLNVNAVRLLVDSHLTV